YEAEPGDGSGQGEAERARPLVEGDWYGATCVVDPDDAFELDEHAVAGLGVAERTREDELAAVEIEHADLAAGGQPAPEVDAGPARGVARGLREALAELLVGVEAELEHRAGAREVVAVAELAPGIEDADLGARRLDRHERPPAEEHVVRAVLARE